MRVTQYILHVNFFTPPHAKKKIILTLLLLSSKPILRKKKSTVVQSTRNGNIASVLDDCLTLSGWENS